MSDKSICLFIKKQYLKVSIFFPQSRISRVWPDYAHTRRGHKLRNSQVS